MERTKACWEGMGPDVLVFHLCNRCQSQLPDQVVLITEYFQVNVQLFAVYNRKSVGVFGKQHTLYIFLLSEV